MSINNRIKKILVKLLKKQHTALVTYRDDIRSKIFDLIIKIHNENRFLMGFNEAYQLYSLVKSVEKIEGDIAEVGTYMGSSAKLICEANKKSKKFYIFDTFEGLPQLSKFDKTNLKQGQFKSSYQFVKNYLSEYERVEITKGLFPKSAKIIENSKFSLVNLDMDIYEGTKEALKFFYTRMNRGGIIVVHDYITLVGVKRAVNDFFNDKNETVIEMSGSQCIVVKL